MNVQEINLGEICSSPKNPRRHEDKKKLEELAASIKQKGVIEPIIVRPVGKAKYEIVAGERRWKAAAMAGLAKIPCLIRDLSDDEAYDFMLIENLQREDLTDAEEAQSFRAYVDLYFRVDEPTAITTLAEKTGISPGYIRSRLRILTLPSKLLKLFDKGDLLFGHLQQLLRVADDKKTLDEAVEWVLEDMGWGDQRGPSVKELRGYIDDLAPALSSAFFQTADVCGKCASSSAVQKSLFDVESKGVLCLRPSCFKKCQAAFLDESWKSTDLAKRFKTNGYRFAEDLSGHYHSFYSSGGQPGKKCATCVKFITIIEVRGKVHSERVCVGDEACFNLVRNPRSEKERETAERDPAAPRASWHGEFHRDVFLSKRIPEVLAKIDQRDPKIKMLLLACAIHGHRNDVGDRHEHAAWILEEHADKATKAFKDVIRKIVLSGQHIGPTNWNGFGTKGRRIVAEYLGIDLAAEFAVDKDYLNAKTKAEILAFGKKFKLLKMDDAKKLKKAELVGLVLDHGEKLIGKVPAEILK